MPLQPPKKISQGLYQIQVVPALLSPRVDVSQVDSVNVWHVNSAWAAWAETTRDGLLAELVSHPRWFSRPPTRETLAPLLAPWAGKTMQEELQFFCDLPEVPAELLTTGGSAVWVLTALTMTTAEIKPVWTLDSLTPDESDTISLYGETVDNRESDTEREIQLEDVPVGEPTRLRNREWDARKSMAKERVREARLKSQIATRVAEKEEERFVRMFGELDDAESRFSEYDLTEDEDEGVAEMEA